MNIQEQIQIVEDNLNEYGQCNITLEEFNFLKDELYSAGCLAGIELGRKDAIEEYTNKLYKRIGRNKIIAKGLANHNKYKELALTNLDLEEIEMIAEEMKEGQNE